MATIFYSLAGEGRGHATRVRTVVEHLRSDHRFVIFAPGDAYAMLAPHYAATEVHVVRIPGLGFGYDPNRRLSVSGTLLGAAAYRARLPDLIAKLAAMIRRERPDLVLTDFEPALPRAALRCGVPFVSLDHQHFLSVSDFSALPRSLRMLAALMGSIVDRYYRGQAATIVSSFCFPGIRPGTGRVVETGPLLRPEILAQTPEPGEHLIVYVRKNAPKGFVETLAACGREVRLYGLGEAPPLGGIRFRSIAERSFAADLAGAFALVTTAGNQLLGEALYLRKPVLALPEPKNWEQALNGRLLAREETGEWAPLDRLDAKRLARFLGRVEGYRSRINTGRLNGNPAALAELRRHLPAFRGATAADMA